MPIEYFFLYLKVISLAALISQCYISELFSVERTKRKVESSVLKLEDKDIRRASNGTKHLSIIYLLANPGRQFPVSKQRNF